MAIDPTGMEKATFLRPSPMHHFRDFHSSKFFHNGHIKKCGTKGASKDALSEIIL